MWLHFALQDLFPIRGHISWNSFKQGLLAWLPGIILVICMMVLITVGMLLELLIHGAKEILEDPKELAMIEVNAVTISGKDLTQQNIAEIKRIGYSLFSMGDFREPSQLISKLRDATEASDPVSLDIRKKLSSSFQEKIQAYQDRTELSKDMKDCLVAEFNSLLEQTLYQQGTFASIVLSEETKSLLSKKDLSRKELQRANLLLLRDIYTQQITKSKITGIENIWPYTTLSTISVRGKKDFQDAGIRTMKLDDPRLLTLEWYVPPYPLKCPGLSIFKNDHDYGIIVSKRLLEQMEMLSEVKTSLLQNLKEKEVVWEEALHATEACWGCTRKQAFLNPEQMAKMVKLETKKRQQSSNWVWLELVLKGNQYQSAPIPILGIVNHVPGQEAPEAIVLESFAVNYLKGQFNPNPSLNSLSFRKLTTDEAQSLESWIKQQTRFDPKTQTNVCLWDITIQRSDLLQIQPNNEMSLFSIILKFQESGLKNFAQQLLDCYGLTEPVKKGKVSANPSAIFLSSGELDKYKYAAVHIKELKEFLIIHDMLRSLKFGTDSSVYNHIEYIRKQLGFARARVQDIRLYGSLLAAMFIMFIHILTARARMREIGIFRASGASNIVVLWIYFLKGIITWVIGLMVGIAAAGLLWIVHFQYLLADALGKAREINLWDANFLLNTATTIGLALSFCILGVFLASIFILALTTPAKALRAD